MKVNLDRYFELGRGPDRRRRPNSKVRRTFEVERMWEVHREISRLILLGYKNNEIAERLGVTPIMVSYTRNSEVVEKKVAKLGAERDEEAIDLAKEIRLKAPVALKLLENVMNGEEGTLGEVASVGLKAKTAENWLGRAGFPSTKPAGGVHLHAHFSADELEAIKKRARENSIIDVTNDVVAQV